MNRIIGIGIFVAIFCLNACKSDPIIIGVPGETITIDTTGGGTIISAVETNLCVGDQVSFQREVLPILVAGCAYSGCHDAATAEEGVVLESYQTVKKEVTPGDPNNSELYESMIKDPNDEEFMPPRPADPLSAEQIATIRLWIEQGAKNTDCRSACNSDSTSFANDVFPLIYDQCYGCHQANNAQGGINLEDYGHIRTFAGNGTLLGSIKHTLGYAAMPPTGNQMTACQIAQIQNWIVQGAQNN